MALTAYGRPLATFPSFKYLVSTLLSSNDYCPYVGHNLRKASEELVTVVAGSG